MKVVVCLIATNKYKQFVNPLLESIDKYFLVNHEIEVNLFIDEVNYRCFISDRVSVVKHKIFSYGFPAATLFRYEIMTSIDYQCDYIYYLDVDYIINDFVDEDIFGNIVAVLHPGFSIVGGGSWCTDKESNAYTYPENRRQYFCGGTSGGAYDYYYPLMKRLKREIEDDENRGVRAEWNDESHLNKTLSELKSFKILDSSYCMPEPIHLRKLWEIDHLTPKILALDKNHSEIRS
jgi:hypothetical protein